MKKRWPLIALLLILFVGWGCQPQDSAHSSLENPAPLDSKYPRLFSSDNTMYMSWISTDSDDDMAILHFASYSAGDWSPIQTIAQDSSWFINWADFPSIIAGENGPIATHWLNKKPDGPYAYDVNISFSENSGDWSPPLTPHADSTATEHGFVSMIPWDQNTILAVWLDGRHSENRAEDQYFNLDYAMTLRGALISTSGEVKEKFLIDDAVCDCCQTSLVKTPNGALVAYRNRTDEEIRDIYVSRFNDKEWSQPAAINNDGWKIGACPVNGPALASRDSLVALAWPTDIDGELTVKAAMSTDGGLSFQDPKIISRRPSLGRVDVDVDIDQDKAYISWLEQESGQALLQLRTMDIHQQLSEVSTVDSLDQSRQSGFPQLEILGDELIMAWTDVSEASTSIRTIRKEL